MKKQNISISYQFKLPLHNTHKTWYYQLKLEKNHKSNSLEFDSNYKMFSKSQAKIFLKYYD